MNAANENRTVYPAYIMLDPAMQREDAASAVRMFQSAVSPADRADCAAAIGYGAARSSEYRAEAASVLKDVRETLLASGEVERGSHNFAGTPIDALRWEQVQTRVYDPSDAARGNLTEIGAINTYNLNIIVDGEHTGRYEGMTLRQLEGLVGRDNAAAIAEHVGLEMRNQAVVDDSPANVSRSASSGVLAGSDLHGGAVPSERVIHEAINASHVPDASGALPALFTDAVADLRRSLGADAKLFLAQEDHPYSGPIIYTNDAVAAQQDGDGKVVLHDMSKLSYNVSERAQTISTIIDSLATGAPLAILYQDRTPPQIERVVEPTHQHVQEQSRDRGMER